MEDNKKTMNILDWFEESSSKWSDPEDVCVLSEEDIECVVEATIKCYEGKFGNFMKLFMKFKTPNGILELKGDADSNGKRRKGVKLDFLSQEALDLAPGESVEADASSAIFYFIRNTEDEGSEPIRRVRVEQA